MQKIKLLKRMAGPDGNYPPGLVLDVDVTKGQQLVDQGAAEWLAPIRQKPIERAVNEPAIKAKGKKTAEKAVER